MGISEQVIQLAISNGGSVTTGEVQSLGGTRSWIASKVREGWLHPIGSGTYLLPGTSAVWRATLAAACHKLGAVVSHESAAQLLKMRGVRPGMLVVSVPVRRTNRFDGVEVRQKTDLTEKHVTEYRGLPVTTPARTILDLAQNIGEKRLARILDAAVASDITTYEAVGEVLGELSRKGKPGIKRLRTVMEARGGEISPPDSELEARLLQLIKAAGLPAPKVQFKAPWLRATNGRVDMAYENHHLVVEADGRRWHATAAAFLEDRERDNRAQLAGWRVLRFSWWDVEERPSYVTATLREALSAPFAMQRVTNT